jgi:3-oxoacyl-[acyl-carrier-protein] synthase-3
MSPVTIAAPEGARHARIWGIGAYRPRRVVPNAEIIDAIDSSDEWIRERSGIIERRFAGEGEGVVEMSEAACRDALAMAGVTAEQVSAVIVATVSHPYQTPAAAPLLAHRLGATDAAAFDISAACAGYCHAVSLANDMVRGGSAEYVLVVGVERLSDFTDKHDRGTAFIFADGAGAAIVGPSDTPGIGPTVWGSDGAQWDVIAQRDSWIDVHDKDLGWPAILMQGQSVFRWAVWGMAPVAQKALDLAGITAEDLDAFIPHQANVRIIDAMAKQLKLPADLPIARDIAQAGNTSAASVPLATERMLREGSAPHGGLALQIGFGAGLVYAAQVVVLP